MTAFTQADIDAAEKRGRGAAWDEAVASLRYEDGSPVEIVAVTNPYRTTEIQ